MPRVALALAALALVPATSQAATTIGVANPTPPPAGFANDGGCSGKCTYLPFRGASAAFVSPITGTIVRWRISSDSGSAPVRLRVLRRLGNGSFMAVGSSAMQTASGTQVDTFSTNLAIRAGDAIGLDNGSQALLFKKNVPGDFTKSQGLAPPSFLADGASDPFAQNSPAGYQLQLNADVEPAPGGGGGGGGGGGPPPVPGAPVIGGLAVVPFGFTVGTAATIRFTLSEAARYTLTFNQLVPGRKRGRRCLVQTRLVNTGPRCTARIRRGTRSGRGRVGANRLAFTGRVGSRALAVGSYELVADAVDSAGRRARARSTRFRIRPTLRRRRG